jgi:hypothetical protein
MNTSENQPVFVDSTLKVIAKLDNDVLEEANAADSSISIEDLLQKQDDKQKE